MHLSKGILEVKIEEKVPDPATPIVLYCGGGNRSALAAENLHAWDTRTWHRWPADSRPGRIRD